MGFLNNLLDTIAGYNVKDYERQLREANTRKEQQLEVLNSKLKVLEAEKNKLLQQLAFANSEIANRESVIERSAKTIKELSSQKGGLTTNNNKLKNLVSEREKEISVLRGDLIDLQQRYNDDHQLLEGNELKDHQIDNLSAQVKSLEEEKNDLVQQLSIAKGEIGNREVIIDRISETIEALTSEKGDLSASNNRLTNLVSEHEQEISTLKRDLDELSQKHNELNEHAKDVENQLSLQKQSFEVELEAAISKVKDMKAKEAETTKTLATLSSEILEKDRLIKEERERAKATSAEINNLTEKIHFLQKEFSEITEQSLINEKFKKTIEEAKDNLMIENRDLVDKISELKASIASKEQELEQKQNEICDLKDGVNKPQAETSHDVQPSINQLPILTPILEGPKNLPQEKEEQLPSGNESSEGDGKNENVPTEGEEPSEPFQKPEEPSLGESSKEGENEVPTTPETVAPIAKPKHVEPIPLEPQEGNGDDDLKKEEEESELEDHQSVRRIEKIFDTETEQEIKADEFFNKPESELIKWREEFDRCIKLGEKRFLCTFCKQQVKITGRKFARGHVSFFAHLHDSADCPIKTSINMSKEEIEARKYGLCQESARHMHLKGLISDSLKDSQSKAQGIDNVEVEKRINASIPYLNWRKPDVCCTYKETNVVFELQLSTTFLSTIVDRDIFYRLHHYYIIWVFNFDKNVKYVDLSNLMMKDIYYTNKRNIFVFDKQAQDESKKRGELVLKCNWLTPENDWKYPVENNQDEGLKVGGVLVPLKDLTFDEISGKVYYYDAEEEYFQAHPEAAETEQRIENDRKQLMERWMQHVQRNSDVPSEEEMAQIVSQMVEKGDTATVYSSDNRRGLEYGTRHLTTPQYSSIERKEDYFLAKFNRKMALYDKYGRQILPCDYLNILFKEFGLIFTESVNKWEILFDGKMDFVCERKPHDEIDIKQEGILLNVNVIHSNTTNDTAYILTDGISVIPTVYQDIKKYQDGEYIFVCHDSSWGVYSKDLKLIIPIEYKSITPIKNSNIVCAIKKDRSISFINLSDCTILTLPYERIRFDEGNIVVGSQNKEGIVDSEGQIIVPVAYQKCSTIGRHYIEVRESDDWSSEDYGLYNDQGKQLLQCSYKWISPLKGGLFSIQKSGKYAIYNASNESFVFGEKWYDGINSNRDDTLFGLRDGDKYALANFKGETLTPFKYDKIEFSYDGAIKVLLGDAKGTIDESGNEINDKEITLVEGYVATSFFSKWCVVHDGKECVARIYDDIEYLCDNLLKVRQGDLWGICDFNGKVELPIEYASISYKEEYGYFIVSQNGYFGLLNKELKIIVPISYYGAICPIGNDYVLFGDSRKGVLSISSNNIVIAQQFSNIQRLGNDLFVVINRTEQRNYYNWNDSEIIVRYGLYDKSGKEIFPCQYKEISLISSNLVKVRKDSTYIIYRISDHQILNKWAYSTIGSFNDEGVASVETDGVEGFVNCEGEPVYTDVETFADETIKFGFLGKQGLKFKDGRIIFNCEYDDIGYLTNGVYTFKFGNRWGAKDQNGDELLTCLYSSIKAISNNLLKLEIEGYGYYSSAKFSVYNIKNRHIEEEQFDAVETLNENQQIPVTRNGNTFYLDSNGTPILQVNETIDNKYTIVNRLEKYGINDIDGSVLVECQYSAISHVKDSVFAVKNIGKSNWSLIDTHGNKLLDNEYDEIKPLSEVLVRVCNFSYRRVCLLYNLSTRLLDVLEYDSISDIDENGEINVVYKSHKGRINSLGEKIYEKTTVGDGYVIYGYLGKYGIEVNGEKIIDCIYDNILYIGNQYFIISNNGKQGLFYSKEQILPIEYQQITQLTDNLISIKDVKGCLLYDLSQRQSITKYYQYIQTPNESGMLKVCRTGKEGFINQEGKVQYEKIDAGDSYYIVSAFGTFGIADKEGKHISPCNFTKVKYLYEDLFAIQTKKWRLYSAKASKFYTEVSYDKIWYDESEDTIFALRDNLQGELTTSGEEVTIVLPIDLGEHLSVMQCFGKIGVKNTDSDEWVLPQRYLHLEKSGEFILVSQSSKWELLDYTFNVILEAQKIAHVTDELYAVMSKNLWGLYSVKESKTITEYKYDKIWFDKKTSTIFAVRNKKTGKLTQSGDEIFSVLSFDLGNNLKVIQCFDKVGIKNEETGEWTLPMEYQRFKRAGAYILFCKDYEWGIMNKKLEVQIGANYKKIKAWTDDIFVVSETQYKSYGWRSVVKTRYGIISVSGEILLRCNYVKILVVNTKLVAVYTKMSESPTYYTLNNKALNIVRREELSTYVGESHFHVGEEYDACITQKDPFNGIFVKVNGKGEGLILKTKLPKEYMKQENFKKGKTIRVKVAGINELNQVKFEIV